MILKSFLNVIVLLTIVITNLYSQEDDFQFTHITTDDGLSVNGITKIFQDSKGFLWFGTYNGLHRYDGYGFKIFLPDLSNPKSISSHSILSLYEDHYGYIWVGTADGLNRFDWKTEQFYKYKNDPKVEQSISNNYVYSIFEDTSGTLWVGTLNGLNKYDREKDNFKIIEDIYIEKYGGASSSITSIVEDNKNDLWLGTWSGLIKIQKDGKLIKQFVADEKNPRTIEHREITTVCEDELNNLWIGTKGKGLEVYNPSTGIFKRYKSEPDNPHTISNDYINTIYEDKLKDIWVGTRNGLNKFERKKNKFTRIFHSQFDSYSLINNDVNSITEDKTGIIWIGTAGGVSSLHQTNNNFRKYQVDSKYYKRNLDDERVNFLYKDREGNFWICKKTGLDKITPGGKNIVHFSNDPKNKNSLSDNYVKTILEDHEGIIWIGTDGGGLNRYNPATGEFKVYNYNPGVSNCLSNNGVTSIYEDHKNNLWVGTYWGFNRFDRNTNRFFEYLANPTMLNGLLNNLIWIIYEDSKGMIWLGTDGGGVSMFNPKTQIFKNFVADSTETNHISGNIVISMLETRDGLMWFGTHEGLNCYNRETGKFTLYSTSNGLLSPIINSIKEDSKGNLWIGTDMSLTRLYRKTGEFTNYTQRNGLISVEFSPGACIKSQDGQLYFGSNKGVIFFNPDSVKGKNFVAPVVITDFEIYNESVNISSDGILSESIVSTQILRIPSNDNVITFDFALLDYFNVRKNNFSYKLEGFDEKWNYVGNRNNATYTNLPPGEYNLLVQASSDGVTSEKEASLQIIIVPNFYQSWWFKILAVIGLSLMTFLVFLWKTRKIKNQNKILETRVVERTKELDKSVNELSQEVIERKRAEEKVQASLKEKEGLLGEKEVLLKEIHHRVKNNLQVISSLFYLSSKKIKDKDALAMFKDSQNRVKSIALVHERLYQSKDLGRIDFKEYVVRLTKDIFRSYGVNQSVIRLDISINNIFINIDNAVPCGLIINELISNSLKYAFPDYEENKKTGTIKIDFNRNEKNEFILVVSDNGVGMPEGYTENKKHSLGLQLVDTLISQLEGSLEMDFHSGTSFKIKLNPAI